MAGVDAPIPDLDVATARIAKAAATMPVKQWDREVLMLAMGYAVKEITDVLSPGYEKRSRETLVAMGIEPVGIERRIEEAQASTFKIMLSIMVRVAHELDARDAGHIMPEHKWRPRVAQVLGNMVARSRG